MIVKTKFSKLKNDSGFCYNNILYIKINKNTAVSNLTSFNGVFDYIDFNKNQLNFDKNTVVEADSCRIKKWFSHD